MDLFGNWNFSQEFSDGVPFEHTIIENFLKDPIPMPDPSDSWHLYCSPIENKILTNNLTNYPEWKRIVDAMQGPEFVSKIAAITGIENLEADPYLHGAGLHASTRNGKLDVHLDYAIHPISKKERRVNIILYMNEFWDEAWGGALEFWDQTRSRCEVKITPKWNTAVVFKTSDLSYHGHPRPMQCPEGTWRKSLAVYYVSDPRQIENPRLKAEFFPSPSQIVDPRLAKLYSIRKTRIINSSDLQDWPDWQSEGNGWW